MHTDAATIMTRPSNAADMSDALERLAQCDREEFREAFLAPCKAIMDESGRSATLPALQSDIAYLWDGDDTTPQDYVDHLVAAAQHLNHEVLSSLVSELEASYDLGDDWFAESVLTGLYAALEGLRTIVAPALMRIAS